MNCKFQQSIFVWVTEGLQRHSLRLISCFANISKYWTLVDLNKLLSAACLAEDPHENWQNFWTHTAAATVQVVHLFPNHLKCGLLVWVLNWFRPNNNLPSLISTPSNFEILSQHLSSRPHNATHRGLHNTNQIIITSAVPVNHLKL